jgi:hypothetical protein
MNLISFSPKDKVMHVNILFTNDPSSDSTRILKNQNSSLIVMTYSQALKRTQKPVMVLLKPAWASVNIALKLISINGPFHGFDEYSLTGRWYYVCYQKLYGPFFTKHFPDIPKGHPAMGHMTMNFLAIYWDLIMPLHLSV